ncbi:MAG: RNA polymerase sigma factor [Actinomycetota bacterium]
MSAAMHVTYSTPLDSHTGSPFMGPHADPDRVLHGYRGLIYAYIRRKGFSAEEADDLTQETLVRAYLHLSGFRGASLDGWLYRIAANVAVDQMRKRRVSTVPLESVALMDDGGETPASGLERAARGKRLFALIGQLPTCHQRILWLRYYEDRSLTEIADLMQCTPMAAKLRVFRAINALRKRCRHLDLDRDLASD